MAGYYTLEGELTIPMRVGGTSNYDELNNKPTINSIELEGDLTFEDLGLVEITSGELEAILK